MSDKAYWDKGRDFLDFLVASRDEQDKEIVRLLIARFDDNWEAAVGTLIMKPSRRQSFMHLIQKGKYQRVITALRKQVARRKKLAKLQRMRQLQMYQQQLRNRPDAEPIYR